MSSGFGSNIKDQVVSSNRRRPKAVGSSSGYGQQPQKKHSLSYGSHADRGQNQYPSGAPPQFAEAHEPQRGKIKAFIDIDAIPDEYENASPYGEYGGGAGGRIATLQSSSNQQQPSSLYQPNNSNAMYGVRDVYQKTPSSPYGSEYKPGPISQMDRRGVNIIPKMGEMRAMRPDPSIQQQQQQRPTSSRRTPPPPLPADRPISGDNRSNRKFPPGSPEDRERRRLVDNARVGKSPGSNSNSRRRNNGDNNQRGYGGDYKSNSGYDDDDDDWGDEDDYCDEGNYNNVVSAVDQYSKYDYNANSDYDEDADGSDGYGRGSYTQHTRIKKPSKQKQTHTVSTGNDGGRAPPPLPVEVSPPKNYNEARAINNPRDRLAYSKAPRSVDYQPNTKPINRGAYVEIQKLKPDLNREELVVKRVNAERIKEFAKNLQDYNKQQMQHQRKLPSSKESKSIQNSSKVMESKRAKALEFAKRVPRPKVKQDSETAVARDNIGGRKYDHGENDEAYLTAGDEFGTDFEVAGKIQSLELKHEESRRQVEAIKRSMGIMK